MSKLLAMMMREKTGVMDLSVVGSPTINNGVVSGFSTNDYLTAPQQDNIESASLELVLNYSSDTVQSVRLFQWGTAGSNAYRLQIGSNGAIFYYGSTKYFTSTVRFIDYKYIKLSTENGLENNVQIFVSNDGISWTEVTLTEYENTQTFTNTTMTFGRNFNGSINFNNSYIKINGTKYNFQFTMPLTKVGSPTITDGVVSGFDTSNYLERSISGLDLLTINEVVINVKSKNITGTAVFFGCVSSANIRLACNATSFWANIGNATIGSTSNGIAPNGSDYFFKYTNNGTTAKLFISSDGVNYTEVEGTDTFTFTTSSKMQIGNNGYMNDTEIDLNKSYIIIAGTKYIFTIGA